jgi:tetratricopeptide (TPR) repeat protein
MQSFYSMEFRSTVLSRLSFCIRPRPRRWSTRRYALIEVVAVAPFGIANSPILFGDDCCINHSNAPNTLISSSSLTLRMAIHRSFAARMSQRYGSRRNSSPSNVVLCTKLDLGMLQSFLLETIPRYSADRECISIALSECNCLNDKLKEDRSGRGNAKSASTTSYYYQTCRQELINCATVISTFITSVKRLPGRTIFEAHLLAGWIQETVLQIKLANQSYLKALWIASATDAVSVDLLAVTLHCLGRTYGALGQHNEAINLLRNAEKQYVALNLHKDHPVLVEARKLTTFHNQRILEITMSKAKAKAKNDLWSSAPMLRYSHCSASQLSLIEEEAHDASPETDLPKYRRPSM